MPCRSLNCEFSAGSSGAPACFRVVCNGRAVTGPVPARRQTPLWLAGNVAVIPPARGGRRLGIPFPTTLFSATVLVDDAGGIPRTVRLSPAKFAAAPAFPAILQYRSGLSALFAEDGAGDMIIVAAGAPAAVLALDFEAEVVLPGVISSALADAMARFRISLAAATVSPAGGDAGNGGRAALEFLQRGGYRCIDGRGEGDDFIWSFSHRGDPDLFAVAGVSASGGTSTILFPFLDPCAAFGAKWHDDGLSYYVKGALQIRPETVTAETKAVVKMKPSGGFLVELCLKS